MKIVLIPAKYMEEKLKEKFYYGLVADPTRNRAGAQPSRSSAAQVGPTSAELLLAIGSHPTAEIHFLDA